MDVYIVTSSKVALSVTEYNFHRPLVQEGNRHDGCRVPPILSVDQFDVITNSFLFPIAAERLDQKTLARYPSVSCADHVIHLDKPVLSDWSHPFKIRCRVTTHEGCNDEHR